MHLLVSDDATYGGVTITTISDETTITRWIRVRLAPTLVVWRVAINEAVMPGDGSFSAFLCVRLLVWSNL